MAEAPGIPWGWVIGTAATAAVIGLALWLGGTAGGGAPPRNPLAYWPAPYGDGDMIGLAAHRREHLEDVLRNRYLLYPRQLEAVVRLGHNPPEGHPRQLYPTGVGRARMVQGSPTWDQLYAVVEAAENGGLTVRLAFLHRDASFQGFLFPDRPAVLLRDVVSLLHQLMANDQLLTLGLGVGLALATATAAYVQLADRRAAFNLNLRYRESARHRLLLQSAGYPVAAQPPAGVTPQLLAQERAQLVAEGLLFPWEEQLHCTPMVNPSAASAAASGSPRENLPASGETPAESPSPASPEQDQRRTLVRINAAQSYQLFDLNDEEADYLLEAERSGTPERRWAVNLLRDTRDLSPLTWADSRSHSPSPEAPPAAPAGWVAAADPAFERRRQVMRSWLESDYNITDATAAEVESLLLAEEDGPEDVRLQLNAMHYRRNLQLPFPQG